MGELLEYQILSELASSKEPLGTVTLYLRLRSRCGVGQATIGRKLAELDWAGLIEKAGNRGRVITECGWKRLAELSAEMLVSDGSRRLAELVADDSWETFTHIMEIRELIEPYMARVAARKATPEMVERIEAALSEQKERIQEGLPGTSEDFKFHDLIAEACGNSVAKGLLQIVRGQSRLSLLLAAVRQKAGGRLAIEHEVILEAIRNRNPDLAEHAMRIHIQNIVADANLFRSRKEGLGLGNNASPAGGRVVEREGG